MKWFQKLRIGLRRASNHKASGFRSRSTDSRWKTLQTAHIWVLIGVGAADGKLDKNEPSAFVTHLVSATAFPSASQSKPSSQPSTISRRRSTTSSPTSKQRSPESALREQPHWLIVRLGMRASSSHDSDEVQH